MIHIQKVAHWFSVCISAPEETILVKDTCGHRLMKGHFPFRNKKSALANTIISWGDNQGFNGGKCKNKQKLLVVWEEGASFLKVPEIWMVTP